MNKRIIQNGHAVILFASIIVFSIAPILSCDNRNEHYSYRLLDLPLTKGDTTIAFDGNSTAYIINAFPNIIELFIIEDSGLKSLGTLPVERANTFVDWAFDDSGVIHAIVQTDMAVPDITKPSSIGDFTSNITYLKYSDHKWITSNIKRAWFEGLTAFTLNNRSEPIVSYCVRKPNDNIMQAPEVQLFIAVKEGANWKHILVANELYVNMELASLGDGSILLLASKLIGQIPDVGAELVLYVIDRNGSIQHDLISAKNRPNALHINVNNADDIGVLYSNSNKELIYATRAKGTWDHELIFRGAKTSIKHKLMAIRGYLYFDINGLPNVVASLIPSGHNEYSLFHFSKNNGRWHNTTVDNNARLFVSNSVAVSKQLVSVVYSKDKMNGYGYEKIVYCEIK